MITPFRKKTGAGQVSQDMQNKQQRFDKLVKGLYTDVFRYAYWLCGDRQMAEDLVQETFLRAWRALDSLKDERAAKSWLITIVRRENARQYERYTPNFVDIETQELAGAADGALDPDSYALRQAMAKLSEEYREPLVLQVIGGFSGEEIAEMLSLNVNTVSTRLFRARNQLKAIFDEPEQRDKENG